MLDQDRIHDEVRARYADGRAVGHRAPNRLRRPGIVLRPRRIGRVRRDPL